MRFASRETRDKTLNPIYRASSRNSGWIFAQAKAHGEGRKRNESWISETAASFRVSPHSGPVSKINPCASVHRLLAH